MNTMKSNEEKHMKRLKENYETNLCFFLRFLNHQLDIRMLMISLSFTMNVWC